MLVKKNILDILMLNLMKMTKTIKAALTILISIVFCTGATTFAQ